ncbi:TraB/GumN family protein [Sphingomonas mesophila]|uniref:TraB/GumN family protein n=1 Tax=Sphingomonas mesophila TaxID=2303576 RepID=UPI0013C348D8|nr:TraB/GumN family protein [Sphingomonas mesophila]
MAAAAALIVPALASPAPSERPAGPAMWAISDRDTTIFLFGTFHALDRDTGWFSDIVRAAFDHSEQLVLETVVPSDPAELLDSLSRHALIAPATPGSPVVSSSASPAVAETGAALEAGRASGISVEHGADAVLRRAATSAGKSVGGLESFDFQLAMFAALPTAGAARHAPPPPITDMQAAWKRGDPARFAALLGEMERQSPETYRRLFADRNARWANWVARRMEQPGVVFVAVGTGHLTGRDSLQQRLSEQGFRAVRIS